MVAIEREPHPPEPLLVRRVAAAQRWLTHIYQLDLSVRAEQFLLGHEQARALLPSGGPRSGVLVYQEGPDLWLGLYLDPQDHQDEGTILEETSHLVCIAWHAAQARRVSRLALELQSDVDRYALARLRGRDALRHFERVRWLLPRRNPERERYEVAHRLAFRYCRWLSARFPARRDMPSLLAELRDFYRAGTDRKLRAGEQAAR